MIAGVPYSGLTAAGVWMAAIGLLGILIRQVGPWRKQAHEAEVQARADEAKFRAELLAREAFLLQRIDSLESRLERQEAHHTAEKALGNHKLRNITACFDAMLMMMEMTPDRGAEVVVKIKEMRAAQIIAEAKEAAIIRAAEIEVCDDPSDSPAMSQAKSTKRDTKRADDSARETCEEVERIEDKGKRRK